MSKLKIKCPVCDKLLNYSNKSGLHRKCREDKSIIDYGNNLLKDVSYEKGQYRFVKVRQHAQRFMDLHKIERKCIVCDYSTYVELCHIKEISSFDADVSIKIVNAMMNLCYLCPNHHKELDNKLMNEYNLSKINNKRE